jgi:hypothetical protein
MKSLLFLFLTSIFLSSVSAQVINVPDNAQKDFQNKYKGATDIKWTNNVTDYTVGFKMDGASSKSHYKIDGTWDYTEKFILTEQAPDKVKESFSKSKYRDWKLKAVAYIENTKGEKLYRYEVKKGATKNYVFFDPEGTLIKTNATL